MSTHKLNFSSAKKRQKLLVASIKFVTKISDDNFVNVCIQHDSSNLLGEFTIL